MPNRSPIDNGTFGLGDLDDAPAAINLGAFMRRDLEFIVQPQRLLRLTFSLNGGFWSIPGGRFAGWRSAGCRSCSLLARGGAWLADSNCDSLNSMTVTASLMLLSFSRMPWMVSFAMFILLLLFSSLSSSKFLVETNRHTGKA